MGDGLARPGPFADLWEWQYEGACRDEGDVLFFHPDGERGPRRRLRDEAAKQVCARCPVLEICREHALASKEAYGVWGGLTAEERELIRHERAARGGLDDLDGPAEAAS